MSQSLALSQSPFPSFAAKRPVRPALLLAVLMALPAASLPRMAQAAPTALTETGQLVIAGVPANGSYDFQFSLFNAQAGGAQVGATVTVLNVPVTGGVYSHLAVIGVPHWVRGVEEGVVDWTAATRGGHALVNSAGVAGWSGPKPPVGDAPHTYRFVLAALNIEHPKRAVGAPPLTLEVLHREFADHLVGTPSVFVARYSQPSPPTHQYEKR